MNSRYFSMMLLVIAITGSAQATTIEKKIKHAIQKADFTMVKSLFNSEEAKHMKESDIHMLQAAADTGIARRSLLYNTTAEKYWMGGAFWGMIGSLRFIAISKAEGKFSLLNPFALGRKLAELENDSVPTEENHCRELIAVDRPNNAMPASGSMEENQNINVKEQKQTQFLNELTQGVTTAIEIGYFCFSAYFFLKNWFAPRMRASHAKRISDFLKEELAKRQTKSARA